ncbi:hypothetical protein SAMN05216573_11661 [Bradyrhizobium sp. Rc3b]|nr:hypothetical protein SAMN05216573_11661 [Bradyrhizobium sp. Rc3b]
MRRAHDLYNTATDAWARFRLRSSSYGGQVAMPTLGADCAERYFSSAYFAFLALAFFAFAAFFAGFSSFAFFSTFAATGALAASRIDRA